MHNIGPAPFLPHDVACPVILDEGEPLLHPYVVSVHHPIIPVPPPPLRVPDHLVVLDLGPRGFYVHIDPRQVAYKRDELLRTGAIVTKQWHAWLYTLCPLSSPDNDVTAITTLHVLFPGTVDRFYFNPVRDRVVMKQRLIALEVYEHAEFYCPVNRSSLASYYRDEEMLPGMHATREGTSVR